LSERELIKYIIKHVTKRKRRKNVVKKDVDGVPLTSKGPAYTGTSSNIIRHVGDREQNELMKQLVNSQVKALEAPKPEPEFRRLEMLEQKLLEAPNNKDMKLEIDGQIIEIRNQEDMKTAIKLGAGKI